MTPLKDFASAILDNVETVIVGKRAEIELVLIALLCRGHVLLEDVPGTGKTMLARAMAVTLGVDHSRLQCTPDLLPNDVTGVNVFNQASATFEFRPGPVFTSVLLADEINRATPRTQSALLEAMQEGQVTVDGVTRSLPDPFLVMATQNPIEYEGTFPLPEAQLDRFLMRVSLGYPDARHEAQILESIGEVHPIETVNSVALAADLGAHRTTVAEVHVDGSLTEYVVRLVAATRNRKELALGVSPRGSLALRRTAQARAALAGRDYVIPDDIKELAKPVLGHRLIVTSEARLRGRTAEDIVAEIVAELPVELD